MLSRFWVVLVALSLTGSAWSKPSANAAWKIIHTKTPGMCTAVGQEDDDVEFGLASMGSDFVLDIWASDFPEADGTYKATLSFDGGPPMAVPAASKDGLKEISLGRGEIVAAVVGAKEMTISISGHAHRLSLVGAAAGLDAAARCAGNPTLADASQGPPVSIAGAGKWTLYERIAGEPGRACMAHLDGEDADTMLLYDDQNRVVLRVGNGIWAFPERDIPMRLSLDGGPDLPPLPAEMAGHVVSISIIDSSLVRQLRDTHVLDWVFPFGSLRSDVTGLGTALDAVQKCRAAGLS